MPMVAALMFQATTTTRMSSWPSTFLRVVAGKSRRSIRVASSVAYGPRSKNDEAPFPEVQGTGAHLALAVSSCSS